MYLLCAFCVAGLTVALPVLPEPPNLLYTIAAALQKQKLNMNIPRVDNIAFPVKEIDKEVEKNVKFYKVFIPPSPKLPDYSNPRKLKAHKARSDDDFESGAERSVEMRDMRPVLIIESKSEPIKNSKFEETEQTMEKNAEKAKSDEEPVSNSIEETKSVDEPIPITLEEFLPIGKPIGEPSKFIEEPSKFIEEPSKFTEDPSKFIEETELEEEPNFIEEELKPVKESTPLDNPQSVEEQKVITYSDSSKVEPKEEPEKSLEDIPVVVQFSIPTTSFLSSIISKITSLASLGFSWPFQIPSFFHRPRTLYSNYYIDNEMYPL